MVVLTILAFAYMWFAPCKVKYGKYRTESCIVVDCDYVEEGNYTGNWLVTVHDSEANEWSYYDTEWLGNGYLVRCYFDKGNRIVDVDH